jgi:putative nucleotidyltransferase with HDIG domain
MATVTATPPPPVETGPFPDEEIIRRIETCPKLASLHSVNKALSALVRSEQSLNAQIAEVIQRDPSLSARLLRMVNSVYFGLSTHVNNIEEAVFFLGLRQIRELSMATPVIDELEHATASGVPWSMKKGAEPRLANASPLPSGSSGLRWKELWSHSIATAILTREILAATPLHIDDDTDYLVGLLHNIGKVVMAYAFPDHLRQLVATPARDTADFAAKERDVIGWDHARIGAHYLSRHNLSEEITSAVEYHISPDLAPRHRLFAAAVQVADHLVRHTGISGGFEQIEPIEANSWLELPGWHILYGADTPESNLARASIANSLQKLPSMLQGLL